MPQLLFRAFLDLDHRSAPLPQLDIAGGLSTTADSVTIQFPFEVFQVHIEHADFFHSGWQGIGAVKARDQRSLLLGNLATRIPVNGQSHSRPNSDGERRNAEQTSSGTSIATMVMSMFSISEAPQLQPA